MKDLDFDELDKAVNSLMTNVPKVSEPPKPEETEKTLTITPTLNSSDLMSFDKLDAVAASATNLAPSVDTQKKEVVADIAPTMQPSTPPAARRGGRFMDVVHPSSDMKKATIPARSVSRQGATIEPTRADQAESQSQIPSVPVPTPVVAQQGATPQATAATTNVVDMSKDAWPDPLEIADFKNDTPPSEEEWSAPAAVEKSDISESNPLTSPFLPDTKVEKRPLGSAALTSQDEAEKEPSEKEEKEDEIKKTIHDPDDQLPVDPGEVPPQLPEELRGDMMMVEADTHMGVPKTELTHPSDEKLLESGLPPEPVPSVAPAIPTGPISIPQQYHEEPSTGEKENAGIYDTDSYHQPLSHPAKKKSGWLWVLWIVIILLVGAGVGAALYFFGVI